MAKSRQEDNMQTSLKCFIAEATVISQIQFPLTCAEEKMKPPGPPQGFHANICCDIPGFRLPKCMPAASEWDLSNISYNIVSLRFIENPELEQFPKYH